MMLLTHGRCLMRLDRLQDAERALLESHGILARAIGPAAGQAQAAAGALVELYQQTGQTQRAAEWREKLDAARAD